MDKNQNDLSAELQKNLFKSKDYLVHVPQDSPLKRTLNPYYLPSLSNSTYSFIVEWQLPEMDPHDSRKHDS